MVLLIYLNASLQSAALRGEGNHLQEHCIFVGERSDHGCSNILKLGREFALDGLLLPRLPTGRGVGERDGPRNCLPCCRLPPDARRHAANRQSCGFGGVSDTGPSRTPTRGPAWLAEVLPGRPPTPGRPSANASTASPAPTRLGQFFGPAAEKHPGLSGFSLLSQGREASIARLALADLAERSLDMQYYVWDGDTTGRIIVEHVMKAADRG